MITQQSFLTEIEEFLDKSGMTPTAFGKAAVRDPNFVFDLREGRAPNLSLVERVRNFIQIGPTAQQKPEVNLTNGVAA